MSGALQIALQLRLPQPRRTRSQTDARDCSCTFQNVQNCVDRRIERCGDARLHNSLHHAQRPTVTALRCASQHRIRSADSECACASSPRCYANWLLKLNPLAAARQRPTHLGCMSAAAAVHLPMPCLMSPARRSVLHAHIHLSGSHEKASKGAVCEAQRYVQAGCASRAVASRLHIKHYATSQHVTSVTPHMCRTWKYSSERAHLAVLASHSAHQRHCAQWHCACLR